MKTNKLLSILLSVCLLIGMLPLGAVPAEATTVVSGVHTGFTATGGTAGASYDENYDKLVDGNLNTKWCVVDPDNPNYIEFYADEAFVPTGYILTTGNDTDKYPGRNPAGWILKAKDEGDASWTLLANVQNDTVLQAESTTSYRFPIRNSNAYKYFRFEFNRGREGNTVQLAELQLISGEDLIHDLTHYSSVTGERFYKYTGEEITPAYTVKAGDGEKLIKGRDYNEFINPYPVKDPGIYTVTIDGINPYSGRRTFDFTVGDGYKYLDENGEEQLCEDFEVLVGGGDTVLGTGGDAPAWYVVSSDVTYNGSLGIDGDVRIILVDGKTLTAAANSGCTIWNKGNGSLTIYAQSAGETAGALNVKSCNDRALRVDKLTVNGGDLRFTRTQPYDVVEVDGNFNFNGGNVTVDGGSGRLYFYELHLSWLNSADSFSAKEYAYNTVVFEKPFKTDDNSEAYSGELTGEDISKLNGKTLVPTTMSAVTLADTENGSIAVSESAFENGYYDGETVTLTITPDRGYFISSVSAAKTGDPEIKVELSGTDKTRTFTMPAFPVTVTATFETNPNEIEVTAQDFDAAFEDYTRPEARTIKIASLGTAVEITSVTLDEKSSESFELNKTGGASLAADGTDETYTIQPKEGLPAGTYTATVTVAYGAGKTASAQSTFTVKPHEMTVSVPGLTEGDWVEGYSSGPQSLVFITNNGRTVKTISSVTLSGEDADAFTVRNSYGNTVAVGETNSSSYIVQPKSGLVAGTYKAILSVASDDGETAKCEISFKVLSKTFDMAVAAPDFGTYYYGYTYAPQRTFTVTYTGNAHTEITSIELTGDDADKFTLEGSLDELDAWYYMGKLVPAVYDRDLFITPVTGLLPGTYTAKLSITNDGGVTAETDVSFTVSPAPLTVTANGQTITFGQGPSNNGVTYSGFVLDEDESALSGTLAYSYTYTQYGNAGTYSIIPGGLTSDNYAITFAAGTLTVAKAGARTLGDIELTAPCNSSFVTADASGLMPDNAGTLSYAAGKASVTGSVTVSEFSVNADTGRVTAKISGGAEGDVITLPVTVSSVNYADSTVKAVITLSEANDRPFEDVPEGSWYYDAVYFCYDRGNFKGVSKTRFAPDGTMTRAMFATVLYRIAGEPEVTGEIPFTDVESGKWYTNAVIWAAGEGIVKGCGGGRFGTEDPVTREQIVTMFWRFKGMPEAENADLSSFTDADAISDWAKDAFDWAVGDGVISGKGDGVLDPKGTAKRSEVAQLVMNFETKIG